MAKAFGVRLDDLLLTSERPIAKRKGPIGECSAPSTPSPSCRESSSVKVLEMVQTLVEQYERKAADLSRAWYAFLVSARSLRVAPLTKLNSSRLARAYALSLSPVCSGLG
jgi:hypothetical protein